jgi:hypothetical protein
MSLVKVGAIALFGVVGRAITAQLKHNSGGGAGMVPKHGLDDKMQRKQKGRRKKEISGWARG